MHHYGPIILQGLNFTNRGYMEINHGIFEINPLAVTFMGGYYTQTDGTTRLDSGDLQLPGRFALKEAWLAEVVIQWQRI